MSDFDLGHNHGAGSITVQTDIDDVFDATKLIDEYLKAYQADNKLSDEEMEKRRSPDQIHRILPSYLHRDASHYNRFVKLVFGAMARMISQDIVLKKMHLAREHNVECFAYQEMKGAHRILFGFAGNGNSLLAIANKFARRTFEEMSEIAYDSVCEFINTINGSFASEMSFENVLLEVGLPMVCPGATLRSDSYIYFLPVILEGCEIEIIFSFDASVNIARSSIA